MSEEQPSKKQAVLGRLDMRSSDEEDVEEEGTIEDGDREGGGEAIRVGMGGARARMRRSERTSSRGGRDRRE